MILLSLSTAKKKPFSYSIFASYECSPTLDSFK